MWGLFMYKQADFLAHYHARSNVESTFSAVKRKFGGSVRSKHATAQTNEGCAIETAQRIASACRPLSELVDEVFGGEVEKSDLVMSNIVAQSGPRSYSPPMNTTTSTERATKGHKAITLRDMKDRDWTKFGHRHEGQTIVGMHCEIKPGVSIRLFGSYKTYPYSKDLGRAVETDVEYDRTFTLGDTAEYDSYNMVFTGSIIAIGEKTVTVQDDKKVRKLSVFEFSRRNRDLDLDAIFARNSDVMMHC